jgi:hypothetical protein
MHIRRPVAALLTALALAGGGALTGCSGGDSTTGTPADKTAKTSTSPSQDSMGNLPTDSNRVTSSGADRAGGNGKGTP